MSEPTVDPWLARPLRLLPNRVPRFYRGGLLLDTFRGVPDPRDTDRPEDWIGSATRAWTRPDAGLSDEGLGDAELDGVVRRVADVIPDTGVLVKLLDAGNRLPVHAHPSRAFAREHLASAFGKTEAWVILATRQLPGEPPPNLRLGFRRDVGRAELRRWIEEQDIRALLGAMHQRPARAGDAWLVPAGVPHAIGAGSLILEVQEPTDYSIVLERDGFPVAAGDAHLGLGWDSALDAIDCRGLTQDELEALRSDATTDGSLLVTAANPFFEVRRVGAGPLRQLDALATFLVGVVVAGSGRVATSAGELRVRAGDTFAFAPAAAKAAWTEADEEGLDVLVCAGGARP
jgi:mannose-6-phosphate isomerase